MKRTFYIAPDGSPKGVGSRERPWDLETALDHPSAVQPGDTLYLRGGRYGAGGDTLFLSRLTGTRTAPLIVRQHPGERATVDGKITARGAWTTFWGFEITNSKRERKATQEERPGGLSMFGPGTKAVNLVVHDVGHPAIWGDYAAVDSEIYGCILWGNGIYDPGYDGDPRGSGIYTHNKAGVRRIEEVIAFRNFTHGIKPYLHAVNGYHLEGNVVFDNAGRDIEANSEDVPMERLRVLRNYTYRRRTDEITSTRFGLDRVQNRNAVIKENVFVSGASGEGALHVARWSRLEVTGNTVISRNVLSLWKPGTRGEAHWDNNTYLGGGRSAFKVDRSAHDFAGWRAATGFDRKSRHIAAPPAGTRIFVRPNRYEPGRGHVIVYNWDNRPTVRADISALGLRPGDPFVVRDAQNYFGPPVLTGTYRAAPLALPLRLSRVAPLIGGVAHLANVHTAPEFAVFVVQRGASR